MARPNLHRPQFDDVRGHPGFRCRRARLGTQAGAERLGVSVWEVPPGEAAYPYHWHLAEEEILIVLDGRPSLRTPDGWDDLEPGDVVSCLVGEGGAHQVVNRTEEDVRFLSFSNQAVEIVIYPDSDKLGAYGLGPGADLRLLFRRGDAVDYWEGETPP